MKKGLLSLALALVLVAVFFVPAAAASDYDGHWAQKSIERAVSNGWVRDDGAAFRPNDPATRAEFIDMINRVMGFSGQADISRFSDVKSSDWYYQSFGAAVAAGYLDGYEDGTLRPNVSMPRVQAFVVFARLSGLNLSTDPSAFRTSVNDWNTVPVWAESSVAAAISAGFVNGSGKGNISGSSTFTRAEAVVLLERLHDDVRMFNFPGTYSLGTVGSVFIQCGGVTLRNANIKGDLTVAEAVGDGTVNLDKVTVAGQLDVRGGGLRSVYIKDSKIAEIVISKNEVRVVFQDGSTASYVRVEGEDSVVEIGNGVSVDKITVSEDAAGTELMINSGNKVAELVVEAAGVGVTLSNGANVTNMTLNGADASVDMASGSKIATLNVNKGAEGAEIAGKGNITTANVKADDVSLGNKPQTTNVAAGVTVDVGGSDVKGGSSGSTVTDSTTSSSGSSSSGGGSKNTSKPTISSVVITSATAATLTLSASATITEADLVVVADGVTLAAGTTPDTGEFKLTGSGTTYTITLGDALTDGDVLSVKNANTTNLAEKTAVTDTYSTAPASMELTQNITAPAANGAVFAQQPIVTLKDKFGNVCTDDDSTVVTVAKNDGGSWTLGGTLTATASNGVATFSGLTASSAAAVSGAQLKFTAGSLTAITSAAVNIPAPTYTISHSVAGDAHTFTAASVGYGAQTPLTVTITNTGNGALTGGTIALTKGSSSDFTLSESSLTATAAGATATFTVTPKTGLAAATYNDTVTVTGIPGSQTAVFTVSFTVTDAPAAGALGVNALTAGNAVGQTKIPAINKGTAANHLVYEFSAAAITGITQATVKAAGSNGIVALETTGAAASTATDVDVLAANTHITIYEINATTNMVVAFKSIAIDKATQVKAPTQQTVTSGKTYKFDTVIAGLSAVADHNYVMSTNGSLADMSAGTALVVSGADVKTPASGSADGTYYVYEVHTASGAYIQAANTFALDNSAAPTVGGSGTATRTLAATATYTFTTTKAGTYYYVTQDTGAAPDAETVKSTGSANTGSATIAGPNNLSITSLSTNTAYKLYIVVEDAAGNFSNVLTVDIPSDLVTKFAKPNAPTISSAGLIEWTEHNDSDNDYVSGYSVKLYRDTSNLVKTYTVTGRTTVSQAALADMRGAEGTYTATVEITSNDSTQRATSPASDHTSSGVTIAKLATPSNLRWVQGTAMWDGDINAATYTVTLTKPTEGAQTPVTGISVTSHNFTTAMDAKGAYTFTVKAIAATSSLYIDSDASGASGPQTLYEVKYNGNGGNTLDTTAYATKLHFAGDNVNVVFTPTPTNDNNTFMGWATSSGGAVAYASGGTTAIPTIAADMELFAVWKSSVATLTSVSIGGVSVDDLSSGGDGTETGSVTVDYSASAVNYSISAPAGATFTVGGSSNPTGGTNGATGTLAVDTTATKTLIITVTAADSSTTIEYTITITMSQAVVSAVTIGTAAPVAGQPGNDGSNTVTNTSGPSVSWGTTDATPANISGTTPTTYDGVTTYYTKYVYTASSGYSFTGFQTSGVTANGTVESAIVSGTGDDTLTVVVSWPATGQLTPYIATAPALDSNGLTYGDAISTLGTTWNNTPKAQMSATDTTAVTGSFAWVDDTAVPKVADTSAAWKFTPGDTTKYATVSDGTPITITVSTLKLTATPATGSSLDKTYDGDDDVEVAITAGTLQNKVGTDDVTLVIATKKYASANANASAQQITVTYSLSGEDAGNYIAPDADTILSGTISKAPLTIKISGAPITKVYDGTNSATLAGTFEFEGLADVDSSATVDTSTVGTLTYASVDVNASITMAYDGTFGITGATAGNYNITQPELTGAITPAPLTIKISGDPITKVYDGTNSATLAGTFEFEGLASKDSSATVDTSSVGTLTYNSVDANASITMTYTGNFGITGATAGNYNITQPTLTGAITQATPSVSGGGVCVVSEEVGESTAVGNKITLTVSGANGEVITGSWSCTSPTYAAWNANNSITEVATFTATGVTGGQASLTNYDVTGITATITFTTITDPSGE